MFCEEGIGLAEAQGWPGIVHDYQKTLLEIAEKQADTPAVIRIAAQLFLSMADFTHYELLKKTVPNNKWSSFLANLIKKIEHGKGWRTDYQTLAEIYAREEMHEKLMSLIQKHHALFLLAQYESRLQKGFSVEIADLYTKAIYKMLSETTGRVVYEQARDYLNARFSGRNPRL